MTSRSLSIALSAALALTVGGPVVGSIVTGTAYADAGGQAHSASATPDRIVLNPTQDPATSQTVTWRTADDVAEGVVQFRPAAEGAIRETAAGEPAQSKLYGADAHHFSAQLTNLTPDTAYSYRVGSEAGWSEWFEFSTPPKGDNGEAWKFLYFGDAQNNLTDKWPPVVRLAMSDHPDAEVSLHAGDQINHADVDEEWGQWFAPLQPMLASTNTITTPGNHELTPDIALTQYRAHFQYPDNGTGMPHHKESVYWTDYRNVRFISMNGNAPLGGLDQRIWLEKLLKDNPQKFTVVTFHYPMFSFTGEGGRDNIATRTMWLPIFEKYDVDLVLQGHDHGYARGHVAKNQTPEGHDGPVYVVAVAGGKYYDIDDPESNNWTRNGAVRAHAADKTSTYQVIEVDGDTMTYRSVVGAKGEGSSTDKEVGQTQDAFTITRRPDGSRSVVEGVQGQVYVTSRATAFGRPIDLDVSVRDGAAPEADPQGTVTVSAGKRVLTRGAPGTLRIPARKLGAGTHRLTVRWSGGNLVRGSATVVRQRVTKTAPKLTVKAARLAGKAGRTQAHVTARVTGAGRPAAGRVEVRVAGRRVRVAPLRNGRVTLPVRGLPRTKATLVVRYLGTPNLAPANRKVVLARR